jgi:ribose 5-phosphate isomerase A
MTESGTQDDLKRRAAEHAAGFVRSGMVLGLGTGSTAIHATRRIAALIRAGALRDIVAIATSEPVRREAESLGVALLDEALVRRVDLTIDGADEVDPALDLIKGGGGALLREKIVAQASAREVIVVDESKLSPRLGTLHVLPVEVVAFGWRAQAAFLEGLGAKPVLRTRADRTVFLTDQGNLILDCDFGPIADAAALAATLAGRAGIVEHGLFVGIAQTVIVAGAGGVRVLTRGGN